MNFRVGQKVVFLGWADDTEDDPAWVGDDLTEGEVYTISGLVWEDGLSLELVGKYSPESEYYCAGYDAELFRPAVEPDISVFTAILTKKQHENQIAARIPRKRPVKEDA